MTRILFAVIPITCHDAGQYTSRKFEPLVNGVRATFFTSDPGIEGDVLQEMTGNGRLS